MSIARLPRGNTAAFAEVMMMMERRYVDLLTVDRSIDNAVCSCAGDMSALLGVREVRAVPVAPPRAVKRTCCAVLPQRARLLSMLRRGPQTSSKRVPITRESVRYNMPLSRSGLNWRYNIRGW